MERPINLQLYFPIYINTRAQYLNTSLPRFVLGGSPAIAAGWVGEYTQQNTRSNDEDVVGPQVLVWAFPV